MTLAQHWQRTARHRSAGLDNLGHGLVSRAAEVTVLTEPSPILSAYVRSSRPLSNVEESPQTEDQTEEEE
jgi:hypothetical protein